MRVLVTGGAGFIGANLCHRLVQSSTITGVHVIDDLSSGVRSNLADLPVSLFVGSILDEALLAEATSGCQSIIHLAAVPSVPRSIANPLRSHEVNVTGTLKVLEAARAAGGLHVVLASSSSVYGSNPTLPKTETLSCEPKSPYAVSKLAGEGYASAYAECYGLPVLPFRFFNVFGPLQSAKHAYAAVIPSFLDAAHRQLPLPIHGDGMQSRDFTFVDTVSSVLCEAVLRRVVSSPLNLAYGSRVTLMDVVASLERILGRSLEREHRPARQGDVRHSQADNSRLAYLFPESKPVDFDTALRATVKWFSSQ